MKVYLSSCYTNRKYMGQVAEKIKAAGHEVVSSWIDGAFDEEVIVMDDTLMEEAAEIDLADLDRSHALIYYPEDATKADGYTREQARGGRHVEVGYALARRIPVILIGAAENVFHKLRRGVFVAADLSEALRVVSILSCCCEKLLPDSAESL